MISKANYKIKQFAFWVIYVSTIGWLIFDDKDSKILQIYFQNLKKLILEMFCSLVANYCYHFILKNLSTKISKVDFRQSAKIYILENMSPYGK